MLDENDSDQLYLSQSTFHQHQTGSNQAIHRSANSQKKQFNKKFSFSNSNTNDENMNPNENWHSGVYSNSNKIRKEKLFANFEKQVIQK